MFRNLKKKTQKKLDLKNKVKNKFFPSFPTSVFALSTFICPNLQIILEKNLHTYVDLKQ